ILSRRPLSKKPTQVGFFTSAVYESKFSQHDEANTDKPVQQCAGFLRIEGWAFCLCWQACWFSATTPSSAVVRLRQIIH
ncbi:hypothetical protein, partial [Serratia marcescens]|uniref:hypothetical protein n=2 Tax=Serratia marcescens TaxID=615 RepID=UPI0036D2D42D